MRRAAQALPGGPDESLPLAQLSAKRTELCTALTAARVHAVPRPRSTRYAALRAEIASFATGIGSVARLCALLQALCPDYPPTPSLIPTASTLTQASLGHSHAPQQQQIQISNSTTASLLPPLSPEQAASLRRAVAEAAAWQSNAGAWLARLGMHFSEYLDLVQPVQLAVQEVRH